MSTFIDVRDLTAPEWIILSLAYQHAERFERGELGEGALPLRRDVVAEQCKPMEALEPMDKLHEPKLGLLHVPTSIANQRPMRNHFDITSKGEAVFEKRSNQAVATCRKMLKAEKPRLSPEVIKQRERDITTLEKLLAKMMKDREAAAKAE